MASRANTGSRSGPATAADAFDEIDSGWEDAPESASVPVRPSAPVNEAPRTAVLSLPPVTSAPRPRSSVRALARSRSATGGLDEPTLEISVDDEDDGSADVAGVNDAVHDGAARFEDVQDEELLDASASPEESAASGVLVVAPTAVDVPDFRRRPAGRAPVWALVGCTAALVALGIAWSSRDRAGERSAARAAAPAERRVVERAPEPKPAEPAASRAVPATDELASLSPIARGGTLDKSAEKAAVVSPRVEAPPARPAKRAAKRRAEPTQATDSPFEDANKDSMPSSLPTPAAAAAPDTAGESAGNLDAGTGSSPE